MSGLSPDQDAFGRMLYDHHRGVVGVEEVVERDDGLIGSAGSAARYFAPFAAWPAHEQTAMAWARGMVLDVGCGAGRHALYLQQRGLDVSGIDNSSLAVAVCRRRGLRDARLGDLATLEPGPMPWDTILLLGANLGLLGGPEEARACLARLALATGEDARIIGESRDPATLDDPVSLAYQEANRRRGLPPGLLRLRVRYQGYATPWFHYLFLGRRALEEMIMETAWSLAGTLDHPDERGSYIALVEKRGAARPRK